MKNPAPFSFRLGVAALLAVGLTTLALAQQSPIQNGNFVTDWSSQRLIFSDPGTEQEAWANGTHDRWLRIVNNPRYVLQQLQRHAPAQGPAAEYVAGLEKAAQANASPAGKQPLSPPNGNFGGDKMKKDWSEGILTGAVLPNAYPATFALNYGSPSCPWDYALFPTGSTGSSAAATIIAYNNLYETTCGANVPLVFWAYNTGAFAVTTAPVISPDGTKIAVIQNGSAGMQLVVVKWNPTISIVEPNGNCTYSSGSKSVSCSGAFSSNEVGSQVTSDLGGIPAGDTLASVSGNTATLATAATASETAATLSVYPQTATTPGTPVLASDIVSCTAPCMTVTFINSNANTFSSPYYDTGSDTLYVGNNISHLYRARGVFNGTTNPVLTPVTLNATHYDVASPVYDNVSGCVFVGDSQGYLYKVNSGIPGTICTSSAFTLNVRSALLGESTTTQNQGIFDAPLVDSTQGMVYAFVTAANANLSSCGLGGTNCIVQYSTSFGVGSNPRGSEYLGLGGVGYLLFDGAFDNVYFSSPNGTGTLWTIGGTDNSAQGQYPNLVQVPITSNTLGMPNYGTNLIAPSPWASPLTEFCNNGANACVVSGGQTTQGNDFIFFTAYQVSVRTQSGGIACLNQNGSQGCALAYQVNIPGGNNYIPLADLALTFPSGGCYGTGGFVIDNAATTPGASNVYFVNMNGNSAAGNFASACKVSTGKTIQAVQGSQSNF